MPQELNVLCCYSCKMFQVHIVKKARKWQCKVCNAKQSIQQVYFQGSGQQCRLSVQKLNAAKANFSLFSTTSNQNDSGSDSCDVHTSIPEVSVS
ncbi:MRN complex-interacting protein isoform X4 [Pseudomyrmex gracilis]|uniref:MRN complex-interacting protein isoform X4 n=1 Tax=Pseudomyrmex gracilis TaxID=219809 RepID=UPI0009952781|nr:MRN complex-interacting protein isoform X4 [Pseudomyrmex gracilis]